MSADHDDNAIDFEVCIINSDLVEARNVKSAILERIRQCNFNENETFAIKLALEEALTNAIKHGNGGDSSKHVTIRYAVSPKEAVVVVTDEGEGFLPDNVPDCTDVSRLSIPSGRGITLMRAYMDEVCYRSNGREVYFVKRRSQSNP